MMTPSLSSARQFRHCYGFTLLEVLVAITLTALVLGSLFALQSQSKRLSFKAEQNLQKTINQRAYFNAAWIESKDSTYRDELASHENYNVDHQEKLTKPEDQTKPVKFFLETFDIVNKEGDILLQSVRFKETELPE